MDFSQVLAYRQVRPSYDGVDAMHPVLLERRRAGAGPLAKARPRYTPAQLEQMARAGTAYRCHDRIVPLGDQADVTSAVADAKIRRTRPDDDPGLRVAIARRAKALGVPSLIPADWGEVGSRGSGPGTGAKGLWQRRAEVRRQATDYELMAARVSDPADAAGYAALAKAAWQELAALP